MKKLLFLFLLISVSFAQNKVRWYDLTEAVKDSIRYTGTINVLLFGAIGDSITDDTQAIQNAMDEARDQQVDVTANWTGQAADRRAVGTTRVFIPPGVKGKYRITSTIIVYGGTEIEFQRSAFIAGTTGMVMVKTPQSMAGTPVATYSNRNLIIRDMTLFGNGKAATGLLLRNVTDASRIEGLRVYGVTGKIFEDSTRICSTIRNNSDSLLVDEPNGLASNQVIEIDGQTGFFSIEKVSGDMVLLNRSVVGAIVGEFFHIRPTGLQIVRNLGLNVNFPELRLNTLGMFIGDDSTTGRSANVQIYGGYIEENNYGVVLDGVDNCSFFASIIQHSTRGSEIVTTARTLGAQFYDTYLESINGDTLDAYGFRDKPIVDIANDSKHVMFYGIRFPQNPVIMGWRRMLRNSGDGTMVSGLRTTVDTLVVNPDNANDYAFIEQNSSAGFVSLEFSEGQTTISNPYIYIIDENGEFPNSRATVILQRQNGRRMSGLYNYYSDTGGDALLALYKTTGNTLLNSRLYFAIDGVHFGQSPDTTGANVRLYSDYAHRLRLETGDTFFSNGDWNNGLFRVATWRIWEDSSGYLRGRGSGDPVSDKDADEFFLGDSMRVVGDSLMFYVDGIGYATSEELNYQAWTVVAKSGGKYSTIQSAINSFGTMKADSQAIVEIMPGEYDETLITKKYVNLHFRDGARLNYKTAGATYSITADVTDTLWIKGGELRRETTVGTLTGVINNSGKLFVTSDITDAGYNYVIVKNAGYFEYHGQKIASDRYYSIFWSTGGTVYVDANYCAFTFSLRGNTKAIMKWNKIVCRDSSYTSCDLRNTADVQIYSGETKEYYSGSGYNQEINWFRDTAVEDSSRLYYSGNWVSTIGVYDTSYLHVDKAWSDEGMPRADIGGVATGAVIWVTNSNIKWIVPTPIARTTSGAHISECGGVLARSKSYFQNSYIQWSKYHSAAIDTAKEYGCMFYYSYGDLNIDNCTLVDYGNDYGYGNMMPFNSWSKTRITNTHFEMWGSETNAYMFDFFNRTGYNWDFEMTNCSVSRKGGLTSPGIFNFNNTNFVMGSSDKLIFNNVTIYDADTTLIAFRSAAGSSPAQTFPQFFDSLAAKNNSVTFIPNLMTSNLRLAGPGWYFTNSKYGMNRVLMSSYATLDTLQETGTDGDSALVRVYYKESLYLDDGVNSSRRNWADINLGISIKGVNPHTASIESYYDVRILSNDDGTATRYLFQSDSLYVQGMTAPSIVYSSAQKTYFDFWIVNNHSADITIDIWIKPSLDMDYVTMTRQ